MKRYGENSLLLTEDIEAVELQCRDIVNSSFLCLECVEFKKDRF